MFYPQTQSPESSSARHFTTTMASSETPRFITIMSPCRLADQSRSYYVSNPNGSSPGKVIDFLCSSASYTNVIYVQDFGLRKLRLPCPRRQPARGSHQVQTANLTTSSFRSFIGPASAFLPLGRFHRVSLGTLDFSTRSLLKGPRPDFHQLANYHAGHTAKPRPLGGDLYFCGNAQCFGRNESVNRDPDVAG